MNQMKQMAENAEKNSSDSKRKYASKIEELELKLSKTLCFSFTAACFVVYEVSIHVFSEINFFFLFCFQKKINGFVLLFRKGTLQ
jgi:hypothetical protein